MLAICFVAGPFFLRQAIAAFETLDRDVLDAARVDGAGPLRALLSVSIPLATAGLAAGAALAFARGIGEFGATIMFAGNLRAVTQTLPLLIYQDFELRLRRLARDQRAARRRQRRRADHGQADRAPLRAGPRRRVAGHIALFRAQR